MYGSRLVHSVFYIYFFHPLVFEKSRQAWIHHFLNGVGASTCGPSQVYVCPYTTSLNFQDLWCGLHL